MRTTGTRSWWSWRRALSSGFVGDSRTVPLGVTDRPSFRIFPRFWTVRTRLVVSLRAEVLGYEERFAAVATAPVARSVAEVTIPARGRKGGEERRARPMNFVPESDERGWSLVAPPPRVDHSGRDVVVAPGGESARSALLLLNLRRRYSRME